MKKRICILLPEHFSSNMGGAEFQAKLLVDGLSATGKYEIYYLCNRAASDYNPDNYTIKIVKKDRSLGFLGPLAYSRPLLAALKKIQPDVLYQNVGGTQTGVAAYYAKKSGAKFIWHIASDDDIEIQWKGNLLRNFRLAPERFFLNYGIRNSDIIAAQTKFQTYLLKEKFGINCKNFIPIGHPVPEEKLRKEDKLTIVWVANLKPLKRPEIFVDLAKRFSGQKDVHFKMIGKPGWGKWYENLISDMNELANIDYLGKLTQNEVNHCLGKSHILINTSRYEGFSNTFVQAWMRNVPVISLSVDPDNILVNKKLGFKSSTFGQLCVDLETLINNNELRQQMGECAYKYAKNNHSEKEMVDCALRLFG